MIIYVANDTLPNIIRPESGNRMQHWARKETQNRHTDEVGQAHRRTDRQIDKVR